MDLTNYYITSFINIYFNNILLKTFILLMKTWHMHITCLIKTFINY